MKISGFSFIHNALAGGYPIREAIQSVSKLIDEIVIVDMQSTDGTRDLLERLGVIILDGVWVPGGGDHICLDDAYAMHVGCSYDCILHFEADEIFSASLIEAIGYHLQHYGKQISVMRIQVEQNFQRIRQYPLQVHRVFMKGSTLGQRAGHTTKIENQSWLLTGEDGFLWDCTNDFRDNFIQRVMQNTELHGGAPKYLMVPEHCIEPVYYSLPDALERLKEPHWTWNYTPLNIPQYLKPLVGRVKYE